MLAAHFYDLELLPASAETHDAISKDGRYVQIKATQINKISISSQPEHLLVIRILMNGESKEIYKRAKK